MYIVNDMTIQAGTGLVNLDNLASQARLLGMNIAMNMLQLGRVFTQAKPLVPHGEWTSYVEEQCGINERYAQECMRAYSIYGDNPDYAQLGKSKLLKMLALPEGTTERFIEAHDVANMSVREVEEAVKQARAEAKAEIDRERAARLAAERRAEEAENRPAEVLEELVDQLREQKDTIQSQQDEIKRLGELGNDSLVEQRRLIAENNSLKRDLRERAEDLEAMQAECSRTQAELLNMQSQIARGDAERAPSDELTVDAFAAAVRQFIGACARMPYMKTAFSAMSTAEKNDYDILLQSVEGWARDSRKALNTTAIEGEVFVDV